MRTSLLLSLSCAFLFAPACGGDPEVVCEPGDETPCICANGMRGLDVCNDDGTAQLGCNCGEATCPADADEECVSGGLFAVDRCGNLAEAAHEVCPCGCAADGRSCAPSQVPPWMNLRDECTDESSCLSIEIIECEQVGDRWRHGLVMTNQCDHPIRCDFVWTEIHLDGQTTRLTRSQCIDEAVWPELPPGTLPASWQDYLTREECEAAHLPEVEYDQIYYVCVPLDDPEVCAPVPAVGCEEMMGICPAS